MTHQIEFIDRLIVLIYFIALFLVGFIRRGRRNDNDFMLSGRRLTLPVFVMTLVSTWYGGILGTGEFTYLYGISNWLTQGLPYYIFACIYAFFIAGRIRKSHTLTIPEMMESHYGKAPSVLSGVFVFILTSPAPYILAAGIILSIVSGLSTLTCAIIVFIFSEIYLYRKGFE